MQIPLAFADAVIGTNGASISYIRRVSGATVTIQETKGVPGEMTVEINGTASQVQTAQQLIQVTFLLGFLINHLYFLIHIFPFFNRTDCKKMWYMLQSSTQPPKPLFSFSSNFGVLLLP